MSSVLPTDRTWARAEIKCSLQLPTGARSPDTTPRCWYFELPSAHDTPERWQELAPRIMFDLNTALRRRQPDDLAWIDLESVKVYPLRPRQVLTMTETNQGSLPWVNFDRARSWEPAVCYYVDDAGRYDVMSAHDFSELLLYRLLDRGEIFEAEVESFLDRYYAEQQPGAGKRILADAEARRRNLTTIRTDGAPKKTPNTPPLSSCPDAVASRGDVALGVPREVRVAGCSATDVADEEPPSGGVASVYLEAVGPSPIQVLVTVRDFVGLSVGEARRLSESAPAIVLSNVPRRDAARCLRELQRVGATASLR